ncbi:MAG: hypothetical protein J6B98_03555 [Bacilli bacterium]|nr:hypothetical protein [Bacilli bacterium]
MNLFKKEKGIVLGILNAILLIWILAAIVTTISNITMLIIKDYSYTYAEYEVAYCDYEYETEEDCKNNYTIYKLDNKNFEIEYKRNIILSMSNVVLILGVLWFLNRENQK